MNESDGHPCEGVPVSRQDGLERVLTEGRARGLLGPTPVRRQIEHATGFARLVPGDGRIVDLGSGGGLPGLVVALMLPGSRMLLLDSAARRCRFLEWAVGELGLAGRAEVVHGRAEDMARRPGLREACDAVVARSFAAPAVTAECARGFLVPGGVLVVSDPPEDTARWPVAGLGSLGFAAASSVLLDLPTTGAAAFSTMRAVGACGDQIPRRPGMPVRRPRF